MLCDKKYRQQMRDRGYDPDYLGTLYGDLINTAIADAPPDMTVTMHLCRGNYKSTFMGAGGYDAVQEILFDRIKVRGYFMEYDTARAGGFALRRLPPDRFAVLGLVTTKTGALESKHVIRRRLRRPRGSPTSTGSACRRSAALPRQRRAISSPRRRSGRNSG